MTGESGQSELETGIESEVHPDVPSHSDIKEMFGSRSSTYENYHKLIFDYLYSLDDDEVVTSDQIIENAINKGEKADKGDSTKSKYIRQVQVYDPSLADKVIDKCPPGQVLLLKARERTGKDINSQTLNEIQRECTKIGQEAKERYHEYSLDNYRAQTVEETGLEIPDSGMVDVEVFDQLLKEFAFIVADDLPEKITSFDNSITGCGGVANELIGVRVLSEAGLVEGEDFAREGTDGNEDIAVHRIDGSDKMEVEVKSNAARERIPRALAEMNPPTALFSFLKTASEVRSQIISGSSLGSPWPENSAVAYVPPSTIEGVKELDEDKSDDKTIHELEKDGKLYLRANNLFAEDMKSFHETGELTDVDADHHSNYV